VCRIAVKPSSEPIYHNRQKDFIVRDGGGKKKLNPQETVEYIRKRWK
jgi:hypothetical protein